MAGSQVPQPKTDSEPARIFAPRSGEGRVFTLIVAGAGGIVRRFTLGPGVTRIGRARSCQVRISGSGVLPVHCRIEPAADGGLILLSESDDRRTLVDGRPVEFVRLAGGEEISIGAVRIRVRARAGRPPPAGAVERELAYDNDFGRAMARSLARTHWMLLSLGIHIALLLLVSQFVVEKTRPVLTGGSFEQGLAEPFGETPLEEELGSGPESFEFDEPVVTPFEADEVFDQPLPLAGESKDGIDPDEFGPWGQDGAGAALGGSTSVGTRIQFGGGDGGLAAGGAGWSDHVGQLRSAGLDIAILFDSTGSMSSLIDEVTKDIREMVQALLRVVPDLRIALITYKGDTHASRYVVAGTPLVSDVFELLNFMSSVEISGGSMEGYAAIDRALTQAISHLSWRERTEKVIVVIGDAAPFPATLDATVARVRAFPGTVSTIYRDTEYTPSLEAETINSFRRLAQSGRGEFLRHDATLGAVRRIVAGVLGSEWAAEIDRVFTYEEKQRWRNVLDRKVRDRDIDWLMTQFMTPRVRPEAVDALVALGGKEVAARVWRALDEGRAQPWLAQRCLYVLSRLAGIQLDYTLAARVEPLPSQIRGLLAILRGAYGKDFPE